MKWPPLIQKYPGGDYLAQGYRKGEDQPKAECPYCLKPVQGYWAFNGAGMQLMKPFCCSLCGARAGVTAEGIEQWTKEYINVYK
jgi:hypothetical protein